MVSGFKKRTVKMNKDSSQPSIKWPTSPLVARSIICGEVAGEATSGRQVLSPWNGKEIGKLYAATSGDIERAIQGAKSAYEQWRSVPLKERTANLLTLRELLLSNMGELSESASLESGKTVAEAKAEVLKGIEVLEFATSLQNSDSGGALEVSRGVTCEYRREPLGVTVGVTPFNFPCMVPMWMIPISLALGNSFILKPSDKVPFTPMLLASLIMQAGLPKGIFSVLHGGREVVEQLVQHRDVAAVGFVGSSPIALQVYSMATSKGKRALCLGGAKNHLIVTPDAEPEMTVSGVLASFTGCAGQRCMAASVLVAVGEVDHIIDGIISSALNMQIGVDMGALIDSAAISRLRGAIERAATEGASLRLDGRSLPTPKGCEGGNWLGPTVIDHVKHTMDCACSELFGPVLSIIRVKTVDEALELEKASRYGNALSVFTSSGHVARYVAERAQSGMVGINVGVPVPREPFSFGGTRDSKYGTGDITGWGGVELWSNRKKVTTKWAPQSDRNWMS